MTTATTPSNPKRSAPPVLMREVCAEWRGRQGSEPTEPLKWALRNAGRSNGVFHRVSKRPTMKRVDRIMLAGSLVPAIAAGIVGWGPGHSLRRRVRRKLQSTPRGCRDCRRHFASGKLRLTH
jgi:hypothetical protein